MLRLVQSLSNLGSALGVAFSESGQRNYIHPLDGRYVRSLSDIWGLKGLAGIALPMHLRVRKRTWHSILFRASAVVDKFEISYLFFIFLPFLTCRA